MPAVSYYLGRPASFWIAVMSPGRVASPSSRTTRRASAAAYLEMPDFDGPTEFLAALRHASVVGEYRPHAIRYARRQS